MPHPVVRTLQELQSEHESEAKALGTGWTSTIIAGQLPGDLSVSVVPRDPSVMLKDQAPRYYLYRLDPITGRYRLIQTT